MISLGCDDTRKGLGLGFGGRTMEEVELEKGEACSYSNNNYDFDASTDPEADLSSLAYIDEKLQHVLGHLRKDFEGGVCATNLGAKFGGYGSFLPTYTRSPSWPHPKSPQSQSCIASRSPKNMSLESRKAGPSPINFGTLPALRASSVNDSIEVEQEVNITPADADELASRCESSNKKGAIILDQKILKVRIKVGSDNLSTQKNAAIYSGLGLDDSPSSSLDESPSGSEGMYRETQELLLESPTSILKFMTSFPLAGEALLSPLPDHLLNLIVKEKFLKENRFDSGKGDGILLGDKKSKSVETKDFPAERKSRNNSELRDDNGSVSKKEVDIDILACEELVSKTLKLPLLSDSYSAVANVKNKGIARNKVVHDVAEESMGPRLGQEIPWDSPRAASTLKVLEEQSTSPLGDIRKHGYNKADKTYDSVKADPNTIKGSKAVDSEVLDPPNQKVIQRLASHEQDTVKLPSAKEHVLSGGKRKSKGSHSDGSLDAGGAKENSRVGSSLVLNSKQTAHGNSYMNKRETGGKKSEKSFQKVVDIYRDVLGDNGQSEREENQTCSLEVLSEDQPKIADKIEKSTSAIYNGHSDRLNAKKTEGVLVIESCPSATMGARSNTANVNVVGPSLATAAPVLIKENWVCCDKCQKWRLLPININPADLPEKWLCSMLNWLPAMNRCSVEEEETTKAVFALYHVPAVENQTNLPRIPVNIMSIAASSDALQPDENQLSLGSHSILPGGSKKHGLKEISNATDKDGPISMMKNMQSSSLQSGSLTDVTQSPMIICDLPAEKHKNSEKEKHKLSEHSSDGGDTKPSKMKGKRITDQDSLRASKKIKDETLHLSYEDWMIDHAGKGGPCTSNGLPSTSVGKDQPKYSQQFSYKDSKLDKGRQQVSGKRVKDKVRVSLTDRSLNPMNCDGVETSRKRRVDEHVSNHLQDSRVLVTEEFSENDNRKEKKARVSKSGWKDSSESKSSGKLKGKCKHTRKHLSGQDLGSCPSHRILDDTDSLKRDSGSAQPSLAATSSSSKVSCSQKSKSGLHKSKPGFHESTKGSSVESVSSSPMRIPNLDKLPLMRNVAGKDEYCDGGSVDVHQDHMAKPRDGSNQFPERHGVKSNEIENRLVETKESLGKLSGEIGKRGNQSNGLLDAKPVATGEYTKRFHSENSDHAEIASERGKSLSLPPSGGTQNEILTRHLNAVSASQKGNVADGSQAHDAFKVHKQIKKADHQIGSQQNTSRHTTASGRIRDVGAPSPMRKDSSSLAATNALKEAKDLKHLADRVKSSGSNVESTALYFQAALKFLHSASLLESCNNESTKHGEMLQSVQIYSSTATLCKFCAHEYERLKHMAAASLAYKCMEVAYMRVIYSCHANASRDRHELQAALQMVPPGESPASDVDNFNQPTLADKAAFPKGVNSSQVAGRHVISARNRPNLVRLLNFARDVNYAMEASRKSRATLAAASSSLAGAKCGEAISSVKKALDFSFQDVEGVLRLIRVAMEAVSH